MTNNNSFKKGWKQLTLEQAPKVRQEICDVLGISCRTSFYPRLNGQVEPKFSEAKAIEAIFRKYGIKDIWGD